MSTKYKTKFLRVLASAFAVVFLTIAMTRQAPAQVLESESESAQTLPDPTATTETSTETTADADLLGEGEDTEAAPPSPVNVRFSDGADERFTRLKPILENLYRTLDSPDLWGDNWHRTVPMTGATGLTNSDFNEIAHDLRQYLSDGSLEIQFREGRVIRIPGTRISSAAAASTPSGEKIIITQYAGHAGRGPDGGNLYSDYQLARTLFHELMHVWQYHNWTWVGRHMNYEGFPTAVDPQLPTDNFSQETIPDPGGSTPIPDPSTESESAPSGDAESPAEDASTSESGAEESSNSDLPSDAAATELAPVGQDASEESIPSGDGTSGDAASEPLADDQQTQLPAGDLEGQTGSESDWVLTEPAGDETTAEDAAGPAGGPLTGVVANSGINSGFAIQFADVADSAGAQPQTPVQPDLEEGARLDAALTSIENAQRAAQAAQQATSNSSNYGSYNNGGSNYSNNSGRRFGGNAGGQQRSGALGRAALGVGQGMLQQWGSGGFGGGRGHQGGGAIRGH